MPGKGRPPPPGPDLNRRAALAILGAAAAAGIGVAVFGVHEDHDSHGGTSSPSSRREAVRTAQSSQPDPPALAGAGPEPAPGHVFDTVIVNGRVIDPDTRFDATANVGIDGVTVTSISYEPLQGRNTIDARGQVVAPGFIDLLSYDPDPLGVRYKVGDGVTTNLAMHGVMHNAGDWFPRYAGNCLVNFGGAFSDNYARSDHLGIPITAAASPYEISQLADFCEQELHNGWIGVDFEPEYTPGVTRDEIVALAQVAKKYDMVCTFHGRFSSYDEELKTIPEIVEIAKQTGAKVHVEHVTSTGGTWHIDQALQMLHTAKDQGVDISACMYPYDYWATYLASARFAPGWQERFRIDYGDLQIAGTAKRLDEESFGAGQRQNELAVAYAIPERTVRKALPDGMIMIGSDAIVTTGNNHPRASGCFARALGRYVRDDKLVSLVDMLAKMTIMPAKRFQSAAPPLLKKGRLQRGADADVTVFDPRTVADRSTVEQPVQPSAGISWVLVNGTVAKSPQGVVDGPHPGIAIASHI